MNKISITFRYLALQLLLPLYKRGRRRRLTRFFPEIESLVTFYLVSLFFLELFSPSWKKKYWRWKVSPFLPSPSHWSFFSLPSFSLLLFLSNMYTFKDSEEEEEEVEGNFLSSFAGKRKSRGPGMSWSLFLVGPSPRSVVLAHVGFSSPKVESIHMWQPQWMSNISKCNSVFDVDFPPLVLGKKCIQRRKRRRRRRKKLPQNFHVLVNLGLSQKSCHFSVSFLPSPPQAPNREKKSHVWSPPPSTCVEWRRKEFLEEKIFVLFFFRVGGRRREVFFFLFFLFTQLSLSWHDCPLSTASFHLAGTEIS